MSDYTAMTVEERSRAIKEMQELNRQVKSQGIISTDPLILAVVQSMRDIAESKTIDVKKVVNAVMTHFRAPKAQTERKPNQRLALWSKVKELYPDVQKSEFKTLSNEKMQEMIDKKSKKK